MTDNQPTIMYLTDKPREPLTMADCDELEKAGLWEVAEIGRKYAVDRPRKPHWWKRLWKGEQ